MSIFKSMAARFGSGSLSVRLDLPQHEFRPGDELSGTIKVIGGKVEQKTLGVLIILMVENNDGRTTNIGDYKVYDSFTIQPKEENSFDFTIVLPDDCPCTTEAEQVFLMVNVVKLLSVDQRDKKYITVLS